MNCKKNQKRTLSSANAIHGIIESVDKVKIKKDCFMEK